MTAGLAGAPSPVTIAVWAPSLATLTLLPALLGAGGVDYYLWHGLSARRMFEQALQYYVQVTGDCKTIKFHARLIPEGGARSAYVMTHYHWFRDEYESLTRSQQNLGSPRDAQWFEPGVLQRVHDIKRRSAALESTDDIVASNAAFLSLFSNWEKLWHQGQQLVLRELNLLLDQCQWTDSCAFAPRDTVEVRELVRAHHQRFSGMTAGLSAGLLQPLTALDEPAQIRAGVRCSASAPAWTATGVGAPLDPPDLDVQHWMYTSEDLGVVGAGGDAGSLYDVDAYAVAGTGIGPYTPRRKEFLRDGAFPGV